MTVYLLIKDNVCVDAMDSSLDKLQQFYPGYVFAERSTAGFDIGWSLISDVWTKPDESIKELSAIDFLKRIPMAKRIAIRQSADPIVKDILGLLDAAQIVHKDDQDTEASLGYLMSQGLLTQDDVNGIWK
jgi:hypothetical protein